MIRRSPTGLLIGSPAYIAPERARGHRAGRESDLWSLGATLYAAVEGRPPYDRDGAIPTLAAVATEDPEVPVRAGPLTAVLDGLLRKDPAERLEAGEAARLLRQVLTEPDPPAPVGPPTVPQSAPVGPPAVPQSAPVGPPAGRRPVPVAAPAERPAAPAAGGLPPGGPARPRRWRYWALLALGLIGVLVAAAFFVPGWLGDERDKPTRSPTASASAAAAASASASGAPSPSATGGTPSRTITPTPTAPTVPAGFRLYRDRTGFALAIPAGWRSTRREHYVYVREPNGERFLLIDQTEQPKTDAKADWQRQEAARRDQIRDYRRIRIESVDYHLDAADWEFTHTGDDGTPLHVLSRGFVTSKNQAYGLYWSTPERQWRASLRYFDAFTSTFAPSR